VSKEKPGVPSADSAASEALLVRAARAKLIEPTSYRFVDLFTFICGKSTFSVKSCRASRTIWRLSVPPP
jgi:hypothetical protein